MTYKSPTYQFLTGYIQALKATGITIPILTAGYDDSRTEDYIYIHVENNDDSTKNTEQFSIDVYVEIISVNKTSIADNLSVEEKVLSLVRQPNSVVMTDFILNSSSFIGSSTNESVNENTRYFQNILRMTYKLNKKDIS